MALQQSECDQVVERLRHGARTERGEPAAGPGQVLAGGRCARARRRRARRAGRPPRRRCAPSKARRVASSTLRKPWCAKPSSPRVADRVVEPGRALERRLAVERRVDPAGQRVRRREQVVLQPAGAELQPEPGRGHLVGGPQPAPVSGRRGAARRTRDSSSRTRRGRRPTRRRPASRCRPGRRGRAARSRARRPRGRPSPPACSAPLDGAGAAGDHDRQGEAARRSPGCRTSVTTKRRRGRRTTRRDVRRARRRPRAGGRRRAGRSPRRRPAPTRRGRVRWSLLAL